MFVRDEDIVLYDEHVCHSLTKQPLHFPSDITRYEVQEFVDINKQQLKKIRRKYKKYKQEHGAEIKDIVYITRDEPFPHIYENADFSPETIKSSINEGYTKTLQALKGHLNLNAMGK